MNEKYGIELELITQKFEEQINKVKNTFKSIENKKIDMSKQVKFNPEDISGIKINGLLQKEIEGISNSFKKLTGSKIDLGNVIELQKYKQGLQEIKSVAKETKNEISGIGYMSYNTQGIQQYIDKYGQVETKVKNTKQEVKKLNNEIKKKQTNTNIDIFNKGLNKITSQIKQFGLALLSIRSIWALVSKSSSAYLAQDTALADKLQSVWAGLRFNASTYNRENC